MKKLILVALLFGALPLCAQNLTTVSASNIQDINGTKLAAGQLCFLGTDQQDNPISFQIGGGGQALKRGYCSSVAAGVVTSFTVPEPAHTSPSGIYYRITVKDSSTGQEVLRYTQVSFTGTTFNFDNYAPLNLGNFASLTGNAVTGNLNVTGNVAATGTVTGSNIPGNILQQIFNSGTGLTQRTAFNVTAGLTCSDNAGTSRTDCRLGTLTTVTFSATPTFDASAATAFKLTLTGNVTSSTLSGAVAGEPLAFEICQDGTGGRTFVPPANVQGWLAISSTAGACSLEVFYYDGSNAQPDLLAGLTGDVTSSPGSTSTTVAKIQGTTVSGTTGSGAAVLATSPTLVTPNIGVASGTSLALGGGTALTTTNRTGTGNLVLATSPTLITPVLGVASGTSLALAGALTGATLTGAGSGNNSTLLNSQDALANVTGNGGDQTLYTFTIPANTVQAGKGIRLRLAVHGNNSTAVTYKIVLGATTLITVTTAATANDENAQYEIFNNAGVQNNQKVIGWWFDAGVIAINSTTPTAAENFANTLVLKVTASEAAASTVTPEKWIVELIQ